MQRGVPQEISEESAVIIESANQEVPAQTKSRPVGGATFSSLRHRNFRFLWMGTFFMSAGQWIQQVTLGWLIYDMTGSAILVGMLNGVRLLPFLVLTPVAGVAADRWNRRRLLLNTQVVLLITAFVMGVLVVTEQSQVWHLFIFTLITGMAWSFNSPVRQALVPSVVPPSDLTNAVALNATVFHFTKMIAPMLGGFLIVWFGSGGNFFIQSATYAGVFASIYMMQTRSHPVAKRSSSVFGDLAEGLKYVRSNRLILGLVLVSLVSRIFAMPYQALMPIFQKDVFRIGAEGLGMLMAAPGIGAVLATLSLTFLANRLHYRGLILIGALFLLGVSLILFSLTDSLLPAMLTLVGVGCFQIFFANLSMVILQMLVPNELRGRVLSLYLLDHGLTPVGALLAGITTSLWGAPFTVAYMGIVVILLALLIAWIVPQIRGAEI